MVIVLKGNGKKEEFNRNKAIFSCIRAGAPQKIAEEIVSKVERKLYNGIPTKQIMRMIKEELRRTDFPSFLRYPLKDSISALNPELHEFEYFMAKIFTYLGYSSKRSPEPYPRGLCVEHEIDVVIEKNGEIGVVECKHHYKDSTFTGLDPIMRQYARLIDLKDGYKKQVKNSVNATFALVATNTTFSWHAVEFAKCRNVRLIAWKQATIHGTLRDLIEKFKCYPLTLFNVNVQERARLISMGIIDSNDFYNAPVVKLQKAKIPIEKIKDIKEKIEKVINNEIKPYSYEHKVE